MGSYSWCWLQGWRLQTSCLAVDLCHLAWTAVRNAAAAACGGDCAINVTDVTLHVDG
jgi:hypothetical protein